MSVSGPADPNRARGPSSRRAASTWPSAAPHSGGVTAQGSSGRQAIPSGVSPARKAASTQSGLTVVPGRVMAPCCPPGLQRCQPGHGTKVLCPLAETADKTAATTVAADPTSPRNDRPICGRRARSGRRMAMHNHAGTSPDRWIKSGISGARQREEILPASALIRLCIPVRVADCCIWGPIELERTGHTERV